MNRQRQSGLAVVELTMVLPFMLLIFFGIVDLGRMILTRQVLINVSREASNLASRGTTLADAVAAVEISAHPLNFSVDGYVILSEVARGSNGQTTIKARASIGGRPQSSRIGSGVGAAAALPATTTPIPPIGQSVFVTEVFYRSPPVTPLGNFGNVSLSDTFYDAAYF